MVKITVYKNIEKDDIDKEKEDIPAVKTVLVETEEVPSENPSPYIRRRCIANKTFCLVLTFLLIVLCIFVLMVLIPRMLLKKENDSDWLECGVIYPPEEEPQRDHLMTSEIPRSHHPNHYRHGEGRRHRYQERHREHKNHDYKFASRPTLPVPTPTVENSPLVLKELFKVDVQEETELIRVPQFNDNHPVEVLHDFRAELTAYHDLVEDYCYIMDLDVTTILPPQSLWDLIHKLQEGYYMPQTDVIEKTMRVVGPPVEDLTLFGSNVATLCSGLDTYKLEDVKDLDISLVKRDLSDLVHQLFNKGFYLMEWTGIKLRKIIILQDEDNQK